MAEYENDYTKDDDYMMWELHEIRRKIAAEGIDSEKLRKRTEEVRVKYKIRQATLTIQEPSKEYKH